MLEFGLQGECSGMERDLHFSTEDTALGHEEMEVVELTRISEVRASG